MIYFISLFIVYLYQQISKENIDAIATQEVRIQANEQEILIPDVPMCQATIFATPGCQATHMECKVFVEGIDETRTVNIVRQGN